MNKDLFRNSFQAAINKVLTDTPDRPIKDNEKFSDYGLDSLDVMSLFLQLDEDLGIQIGEEIDPEEYNTLDKIFNYIASMDT